MNKKEIKKKIKNNKSIIIFTLIVLFVIGLLIFLSGYIDNNKIRSYDLDNVLSLDEEEIIYSDTYNVNSQESYDGFLRKFISSYYDETEQGNEVYLIFGNRDFIDIVSYNKLNSECTCKDNLEVKEICSSLINNDECEKITFESKPTKFNKGSNIQTNVVVESDKNQYHFKLDRGENFYFIVIKD